MSRLNKCIVGFIIFVSLYGWDKTPVRQSALYQPRLEPSAQNIKGFGKSSSPVMQYNNLRDGLYVTLVDSSPNGYGMISGATRPLAVNENGLFLVYRQWAVTNGQIGGAFSPVGTEWTIYQNLNGGMTGGRSPNALGSEDFPYTIWTQLDLGTGSELYYTFDESGWGGSNFINPSGFIIEPGEFWPVSSDHSYDPIANHNNFNFAIKNWETGDVFIFHAVANEEGYLNSTSPPTIAEMINSSDLAGSEDYGSLTSNPILDVNDNGIGYVAVSSYFDGADMDNSPYANLHTMIFKKTEDYGATWTGDQLGSGYYFIPDNVFYHMLYSGAFPDNFTAECPPYGSINWDELFCSYDFDLRVDSNGNPHFILGVMPSNDVFVYPGIVEENGFWHFWIDKDYLSNPGEPNTPTGWNYALVTSARDSWNWANEDGESYWQITFPSLAISAENDDVMYVVSSMVNPGEPVITDDGGTPEDPCDDFVSYPEWNEEVYVIKSENGGETWSYPYNATNTPDLNPNDGDRLDEISAHAAPDGATNERVYLSYQIPDWLDGSTTGNMSAVDHKCRLYAGWIEPIVSFPAVDIEVEYNSGWNLAGLPLEYEVIDSWGGCPVIFPLYYYTENGYLGLYNGDDFVMGTGYWLLFEEACTAVFSGTPVESLEISLVPGWNLIAGISYPVDLNEIIDPDSLIVTGTLYGFDGTFYTSETIEPGFGYWLGSYGTGTIIISSVRQSGKIRSFQPPENAPDVVGTGNTLTINGQTLYFGVSIPDDEKLSYSLPPKPPQGAFACPDKDPPAGGECIGDVRFAGDWKYCEDYGVIEIMNPGKSLTVSYEVKDSERWVLVNSATGEEYALTGAGEIRLNGVLEKFVLKKMDSPVLPESYALHPPFPNPFNPVTTIRYNLPEESQVSIKIYDITGRLITDLVTGFQPSGFYETIWNASQFSSGVYFVQFKAQKFVHVQKIMLIK